MGPAYLFVKLSRFLESKDISSARFDFYGSGESDGAFHQMNLATMQEDLLDITDYINSHYSPRPLIILGHSLGGLVAALNLERMQPDGMILLAPVADTKKMHTQKAYLINTGLTDQGYIEFGPHELNVNVFDNLENADPLDSMSKHYRGKLLLIQGSADATVPADESKRYIDTAKQSGIESTYHLVNGADHNFSRVSDITALCQYIASWTKEL